MAASTEAEAERLRAALEALRDQLERSLAGSRDAARPVGLAEPIGRLSRMDAMQQQKMAQASREGIAQRANQVRAALARFEDGTYGLCVSCEENVGFPRLQARPESPLCIACQRKLERR